MSAAEFATDWTRAMDVIQADRFRPIPTGCGSIEVIEIVDDFHGNTRAVRTGPQPQLIEIMEFPGDSPMDADPVGPCEE